MPVAGNPHQSPIATVCTNCGEQLTGAFCSRCGQKALPINPSVHELAHDAVHELLHVDGRLFQSIRLLLTRPGYLTREHFDGRRARYLSPIRLYLIFSVLYFAVVAIGVSAPAGVALRFTDVEPGELQALGYASEEELNAAVAFTLTHGIPRAMFVLVPVFGALVWLANRRSGWKYPQHVYFALHVHAAVFGIGALGELSKTLPDGIVRLVLGATVAVWQVTYVVLAQRRTYDTRLLASFGRMAAIGVIYMIAVLAAAVIVVAPFFLRD